MVFWYMVYIYIYNIFSIDTNITLPIYVYLKAIMMNIIQVKGTLQIIEYNLWQIPQLGITDEPLKSNSDLYQHVCKNIYTLHI